MDMFAWLEPYLDAIAETDRPLAEDLERLPSWVVNGQRSRVQAALPRMLAEIRRRDLPWLEVYVRHWGMQSRVKHYEVGTGLREAVDLMERAHRPDARDCPQAVCAVQDLCIAYERVDGPGYAVDRESAARETLSRIDPTWPCYRCIGEELTGALEDQGRIDESLAWYEAHRDRTELWRTLGHAGALAIAGRLEEALALADRVDMSLQGEVGELDKRLLRASLLARLGRTDEALAAFPPWTPLLADTCSLHTRYVETLVELERRGAVQPTVEHTRRISHIVRTLRDRGAIRAPIRLALRWARHVLDRTPTSRSIARELLAIIEPLLPRLRGSFGDLEAAEALRARLAADPAQPASLDPDEVAATLASVQGDFDIAEATALAVPQVQPLVRFVADHWTRRGFPEVAERYYASLRAHHPDDPDAWAAWLGHLEGVQAWDRLEAALEEMDAPALARHRLWFRGRLCETRGDSGGARSAYRALIDADPAWCGVGVYARSAELSRASGDPIGALDVWTTAIAVHGWSSARWQRLTLATELERWDLVRQDAEALKLPVDPGEGEIDERWSTIRLHLPDGSDGWALRTGPATARLLHIRAAEPECHGELWVFLPELVDEDPDGTKHFRARTRLRESRFVGFTVDGAALDEARLESLRALAESQGGVMRRYSGDAYAIASPESVERVPAVYLKVAVERDQLDIDAWRARLAQVAEGLPGPLVWLELCQLAGDDAAYEEQRAVAQAWGMV